jgi:hypothetical protein
MSQFTENLTRGATWKRGLFMLLFLLIYGVAEILISAVVVLQFFFVLFSGEQNVRLREFGSSLSIFVYQIMSYWTYNSEEKPFPFGGWPGPADGS